VEHYIRKNNENPVDEISKVLRKAWGGTGRR
jgi:hypothetical protein